MGIVTVSICVMCSLLLPVSASAGEPLDIDHFIDSIQRSVSGERARDYTLRLWQYEKWYTSPMQKKAAAEAVAIMRERSLDNAEIVNTPADGVTRYGSWTNPIGWDVGEATLEIVEPKNVPEKFRYLSNYHDNPTSLIGWSCPTPSDGIETELVLLEEANERGLRNIDARGKIILISSNTGGMKRHLNPSGAIGLVSDGIERHNSDFITANTWHNTWSDRPGGWMMNAGDSRNNFGFMISQKKGAYLRNLLKHGTKVVVRAKIDSRYYTDDVMPYVTGSVQGTGDDEVLIVGHMFEWGANDNSSGCASILEALGTIQELIDTDVLARPKRSIRAWMGHELYGSMAFSVNTLDRLRDHTIACVCCDTPTADYDASTTVPGLSRSLNACPSYTDALFPALARRYYRKYVPDRKVHVVPFRGGTDNFFCEPMIGVPTNSISMNSGGHLHHNSMDTIEKVDPRTLRDLTNFNAAYLYYMAQAGTDDVPFIARTAYEQCIASLLSKTNEMIAQISDHDNGASLGYLLMEGQKTIDYYAGLQKTALLRIERLADEDDRRDVRKYLEHYCDDIDDIRAREIKRFRDEVTVYARNSGFRTHKVVMDETDWTREAESIVPKRNVIGTLTFDGIPVDEWRVALGAARWWSPTSWAAASYWWCDGKRNLLEIQELMALEAGRPVRNFDLVEYYRFLEKFDMVDFVQ
jgi:hypothetical protein